MSYLKVRDWEKAEKDASLAVKLNSKHTKSFQRRATARFRLGKLRACLKDLQLAESTLLSSNNEITDSQIESLRKEIFQEKNRAIKALQNVILSAPRRSIAVHIVENQVILKGEDQHFVDGLFKSASVKEHISFEVHKPKSWYEFESRWKSLPTDKSKIAFLRTCITPSHLTKLYQNNGMEDADLLVDLIQTSSRIDNETLQSFPSEVPKHDSYLYSLGNSLPNLDILALMLCDSQRSTIREAIIHVSASINSENKEQMEEAIIRSHPLAVLLKT